MYHLYFKTDSSFNPKKKIADYDDIDQAYEKIEQEKTKNPDVKYIIEETTGYVDSYGELVADVVEEN